MSSKKKSRGRLEQLHIRSLGVIEEATIEFSPGLTILTGETGAGKTMVLTALGLVLGGKADAAFIRKGSERLSISAEFELAPHALALFEEAGADIEGNSVILSRTLTSEAKSRAMVGGVLSTASKVAELSEALIQIHGQSTNQRLAKPQVQRELLDNFLESRTPLEKYQLLYDEFTELSARIAKLKAEAAKRDSQIAELKEFIKAFNEVNPLSGELSEIENEISRLSSVEEINESLTTMLNILDNEEFNVVNNLQQSRRAGENLRGKDSKLDLVLDKFADSIYQVGESVSDLLVYLSSLEANPAQFEALQLRKAAINSLIKKFGVGSDKSKAFEELVLRGSSSAERLADLEGGDSHIAALEAQLDEKFVELRAAALHLSDARSAVAQTLSDLVTRELHALSMPHATLLFGITQQDPHAISSFTNSGIDDVRILFGAHKGADPQPLAKVASGGELSRVMLALEVVIAAKSDIGTYVFDEVDSGVGGKAAFEIGRRLKKLAESSQVIVVTHLPQVAVWGDLHLVVTKDESGSVTASNVLRVADKERVVELARLLSGQDSSESAQEHAMELLNLVAKE